MPAGGAAVRVLTPRGGSPSLSRLSSRTSLSACGSLSSTHLGAPLQSTEGQGRAGVFLPAPHPPASGAAPGPVTAPSLLRDPKPLCSAPPAAPCDPPLAVSSASAPPSRSRVPSPTSSSPFPCRALPLPVTPAPPQQQPRAPRALDGLAADSARRTGEAGGGGRGAGGGAAAPPSGSGSASLAGNGLQAPSAATPHPAGPSQLLAARMGTPAGAERVTRASSQPPPAAAPAVQPSLPVFSHCRVGSTTFADLGEFAQSRFPLPGLAAPPLFSSPLRDFLSPTAPASVAVACSA